MDNYNEIIEDDVTVTEEDGVVTVTAATSSPSEVEVVGVHFSDNGKTYYFDPCGTEIEASSSVIVETSRGTEFGTVSVANKKVPASEIVPPLRPVLRIATEADVKHHEELEKKEAEAMTICAEKITAHGLGMKLIDAEYTFDGGKLVFYFSADGRVDFRDLVKDLASVFHTRIELRQIGIRDEAKLIGGLGVCGRPFCCSTFLSDFVQVSIKMAKEQNLSLNSSKISGTCGRLMCCLKYEHETYEEEIKLTPPVGSRVMTKSGPGTVKEIAPLSGIVRVLLDSDAENPKLTEFHRDTVSTGHHAPKIETPAKAEASGEEVPVREHSEKREGHRRRRPRSKN